MEALIACTLPSNLSVLDTHVIVFPYVLRRSQVVGVKDEPDFESLMEKVKLDRCHNSFQHIFDSFFGRVVAYLQNKGLEKEKAVELAQDAFVAVWKRAELFDPSKGTFKVWLFTIVRNLSFDHFRSKKTDVLTLTSADIYDFEDPITSQDFFNLSDLFSIGSKIRERVQCLPPEQREVIESIYFDGYSQSEYAELHKIPVGTVKSRIRLAIARLRKEMEEQ